MSMLVEKKTFSIPAFTFTSGRTIPVQTGYETYGTLNEAKDNAILVVHYFGATSHAAGKYEESDPLPGFWDGLIGPGKAVDTDKYFVVCCDNLCNVNPKSPRVSTVGPMSIDPGTGKRYGLSFPVPEVLDVVNVQKALLESMGITHLRAVMGPSFGGMSSWQWAVAYPDWMDKIIPVISTPRLPVWGGINPLQYGIRVARLDHKWNGGDYYDKPAEEQPVDSMSLALEMMLVAAYQTGSYERFFPRDTANENPGCYESILEECTFEKRHDAVMLVNQGNMDLNHWLYTCRMCLNYDLSRPYGGDIEKALGRIKAKVLSIPCKQDLLHPAAIVSGYVDIVNKMGGQAECYQLDSDYGHMAGIAQTHLFADKIKAFLEN